MGLNLRLTKVSYIIQQFKKLHTHIIKNTKKLSVINSHPTRVIYLENNV